MPTRLFFDTPEHRLGWARQRYFEDGVRPTGLVSEAVIQSWARCLQARLDPSRPPVFNPVSASRVQRLAARHRPLLMASADTLQQLQRTLAGTGAVALLTDAHGVVLQATRGPDAAHAPVLAQAARPGVDLSEACIGTNAPALASRLAAPCVVLGGEHFASAIQAVHCAAAAIRGPDRRVAAVLDLSIEGRPFGFDAAAVVGLYAASIENDLLLADSSVQLVLRLHLQPAQLDSVLVGLVGVDGRGQVAWMNPAAEALLGPVAPASPADAVLGLPLAGLQQLAHRGTVQAVRLATGLQAWLQAEWRGMEPSEAAAMPAPAPVVPAEQAAVDSTGKLRDARSKLVLRTLQACGGNVSAAARQLGVSRGLVYRQCGRQDRD